MILGKTQIRIFSFLCFTVTILDITLFELEFAISYTYVYFFLSFDTIWRSYAVYINEFWTELHWNSLQASKHWLSPFYIRKEFEFNAISELELNACPEYNVYVIMKYFKYKRDRWLTIYYVFSKARWGSQNVCVNKYKTMPSKDSLRDRQH